MLEFLSWSNFFYLVGILLGGYLTLVASKYKRIVKEVQDVSNALEKAYEDGNLTKKEKEDIMKEALDVLKALINLKWKLF
jgi:hypothetical protein|tara:strand:+ start:1788 stop:2027 length:240 start_codon:yes stop_codon:yes gene_type:complete